MMKGTEWEALPILSAAAPFKAGGRGGPEYYTDVPVGPVAIKNVADLYLYPNTIQAVAITGAEVKDWLERSAGIFNQVTAGGADQPLSNMDFPSYNFDVIDGVTYKIDLTPAEQVSARTARKSPTPTPTASSTCMFNGAPIDPAAEVRRRLQQLPRGGGGSFPGTGADKIVFKGPDTNRDLIIRYIVENGTINPKADSNWSLAPIPGTTVLFSTGPKAAEHLADVTAVKIEADRRNRRSRLRRLPHHALVQPLAMSLPSAKMGATTRRIAMPECLLPASWPSLPHSKTRRCAPPTRSGATITASISPGYATSQSGSSSSTTSP